jgi:hypothetical protein
MRLKRTMSALAVVLLALLGSPPPARAATDHVIVVVLDGVRSSECLDDPAHAYVPRLWNDLRPLGVHIPEFRNGGWTQTIPGHGSLLTGTWQFLANDGSQRPTSPTLFEYWRVATGAPDTLAWLVAGKGKIESCAYSSHPGYGAPYGAKADCADRSDVGTFAAFRNHLVEDRPRVSMLNLAGIDVIAHQGNWNSYLRAIEIADSLVYELWISIQSDPTLMDRTALFITGDHGRHDDAHGGFISHGDGCEGCRRLPFIAIGPDFVSGRVGTAARDQRDICPTIGSVMGFPTPAASGTVMTELWEAPTFVDGESPPARVQVAPNPGAGPIRFHVTAPGGTDSLKFRIWSVSGRLVFGAQGAAKLEVLWDGRDESGRMAPAGLYFWEVAGEAFRERGHLTLTR